jgi:LacI family transcriptional regulator
MTHRFPIKEIALQSGLGTATVDRVLNGRANVSPQTRIRVHAAIRELADQEQQLAARGRRMLVDFVVEAPQRFSREIRHAADAVLPEFSGAVFRPRFAMQEIMRVDEVVAVLDRIARRGSQGVCLKARDLPEVRDSIDRLVAAGIPVVTLVTDIPGSRRAAYAGLDNASAGRTAGFLIARSLRDRSGTVLMTRSQGSFLGEDDRARGFADMLARHCPGLALVDVSGGGGVPFETRQEIARAASRIEGLTAVYSMGGGNKATLEALAHHGLSPQIYIGHDLDGENLSLLRRGSIDFVLHHDLRIDIRNAFRVFLHRARLLPHAPEMPASDVQIITPENIPAHV